MPPNATYKGKVFTNVIDQYLDSGKFNKLRPSTQRDYRRYLDLASQPDALGDIPCDQMRPSLVQDFLDGFDHILPSQQKALTTIKAVEKFALVRELLPFPITTGCEAPGTDGGHVPWTEEQVAYAQSNLAPYLARGVTLAANTGQRGSDLVKMRWTDIEIYQGYPGINVVQQKTGVTLWVPFTQPLITAMENWQREPGFILRKINGAPYDNRAQLTDAWDRERARHPQLAGLRLHGLRGTAVMRLQSAGCKVPEISSFVGMSQKMVERYTRKAEQREKALTAMRRLKAPSNVVSFKLTGQEP